MHRDSDGKSVSHKSAAFTADFYAHEFEKARHADDLRAPGWRTATVACSMSTRCQPQRIRSIAIRAPAGGRNRALLAGNRNSSQPLPQILREQEAGHGSNPPRPDLVFAGISCSWLEDQLLSMENPMPRAGLSRAVFTGDAWVRSRSGCACTTPGGRSDGSPVLRLSSQSCVALMSGTSPRMLFVAVLEPRPHPRRF